MRRRSNGYRAQFAAEVAMAMAAASALIPNTAQAHAGTGLPGGFAAGFLHPLSGFDHLLAMVCVGLWGAFLGRPLIYVLPVIFPVVMVVGAAIGMIGAPLPKAEIGVALSVVALGACVAFAFEAPVWLAAAIVAVFAIFHGYAHGRELPSAADPVGYSLGFVLATGLLHVSGVLVGLLKDQPGGRRLTRNAGGLIALVGLAFLAQAIAA